MKKLSILFVLAFFASALFAFDANMEINFNIPLEIGSVFYSKPTAAGSVMNASNKKGTIETESATSTQGGISLGGSIGADFMFNKVIGIGLDISANGSPFYSKPFIGKQYDSQLERYNYIIDNASTYEPNKNKNDSNNHKYFFFNMSYFLGPAIRPVYNDDFSLVMTPGVEYVTRTVMHTVNNDMRDFYVFSEMGVGFDLRFAFRFSDVVALNVGTYEGFSFVQLVSGTGRMKDYNGDEKNYMAANANFIANFKWTPRVGIAIYF